MISALIAIGWLFAGAILLASNVYGQVPECSLGGQTLEVPDEQLDAGEVAPFDLDESRAQWGFSDTGGVMGDRSRRHLQHTRGRGRDTPEFRVSGSRQLPRNAR